MIKPKVDDDDDDDAVIHDHNDDANISVQEF